MTTSFMEVDGVPHKVIQRHINFGLAVDVERKDKSRSLLVPNIKIADTLDFNMFFSAYNELLRKVKTNTIEPDDFLGTTVSLTNPGMIGTVHSTPCPMAGQSCIAATGYRLSRRVSICRSATDCPVGISKWRSRPVLMITALYRVPRGMFLVTFSNCGRHG
jgi:2-oxoglutarate dehydrogenase E1 component